MNDCSEVGVARFVNDTQPRPTKAMKRKKGSSSGKRGGGGGGIKQKQTRSEPSQTAATKASSSFCLSCTTPLLCLVMVLVLLLSIYVAFVPEDFAKGYRNRSPDKTECKNCAKNDVKSGAEETWTAEDEEKALEELEELYINSGLSCRQLMDGAKAILDKRPKEEWEHALDLLATCALQEPDNASPRWFLAVVLDQLGREDEALNFLDEALDLDPNNLEYLKTGGAMLSRKGYHSEAIRCLERFLERSLHVLRWEELLASISIQREDEWSFLFEIDDIIQILEVLQTSYLSEKKLIKAGYLYKILIGLKGDTAELDLMAAYSFFAFGLGDCTTGIHYLRQFTEKQYVMQGYGDAGQAYDVVTAHSLRLFTAGFDSNIVNIAKKLLMAGETVWDELEFNCELTKEDFFNFIMNVRQADVRRTLVRCIRVQNILKNLIQDGATVYADNMFGWTPLLHTSALGSPNLVKQLLKYHADVQARTVLAHTSLHVAAMHGSYDAVEPLVQAGLKPSEKDYFNRTALQVACLHRWSAEGMAKVLHMRLPSLCPYPVDYSPPSKLYSQGGWLNSGAPLPVELTRERCDFDVMTKSSDINEFVFNYLSLQRPVLVRNVTNSHLLKKLYQTWQRNKFEQEFGKLSFTEAEIPFAESFGYTSTKTTLKDFMEKLKRYHSETKALGSIDHIHNPTYIFETVPPDSPLLDNFRPPGILNSDLTHISTTKTQFYLGPPLSGVPVQFHRNSWDVLIYGQRRWFVYPPDRAFYSKQHVWEWWKETYKNRPPDALECMQYPGDMVFVPDMWGQGVINFRESVGVASEFVYGAAEFSI